MYLVSKTDTFATLFFVVSFSGLFTYVILATYSFHTAYSTGSDIEILQDRAKEIPHPDVVKADRADNDLKYILLWKTNNIATPIEEGQSVFKENNCSYLNCFVTTHRNLLNGDYKHFDAIVFNVSMIYDWRKINLPKTRSPHQKYVFHSMVPSNENPICTSYLDGYFNWTWSYKLYSDIVTPFLEVKDLKGEVVAPHTVVQWPKLKYSQGNKSQIITKTKSVALLIVNCKPKLFRNMFIKKMEFYLKEHELAMDVYGCNCLKISCMKGMEKEYYFYLIYEDSMSEDYVSREVFSAYNNGAVPILVGGADYSKFLPEGSYMEAPKSHQNLAAAVDYMIRNPSTYNSYHAWRLHYTVHEVNPLRGYCDLCRLLNNQRMQGHSSYRTFRKWWYYGPLQDRCYPKGAEQFSDVLSYIPTTDNIKRKIN